MPAIIENAQQMNALAEIEEALSIIGTINTISSAQGGTLFIQYKPEKGRKLAVALSDATRSKALGILTATKERLAKEVKTKAAKFRISLDEKDLACINGQPAATPEAPGLERDGDSVEEDAVIPEHSDESNDAELNCEIAGAMEDDGEEDAPFREPDLF